MKNVVICFLINHYISLSVLTIYNIIYIIIICISNECTGDSKKIALYRSILFQLFVIILFDLILQKEKIFLETWRCCEIAPNILRDKIVR